MSLNFPIVYDDANIFKFYYKPLQLFNIYKVIILYGQNQMITLYAKVILPKSDDHALCKGDIAKNYRSCMNIEFYGNAVNLYD